MSRRCIDDKRMNPRYKNFELEKKKSFKTEGKTKKKKKTELDSDVVFRTPPPPPPPFFFFAAPDNAGKKT